MINKRIFKYLKKTFSYLLVIIMSININTYAAIGGNDGSAFITKSEFDAVINTFNEQMDNYEKSLVSKIDGAIANYLTALSDEVTIMLDDLSSRVVAVGSQYTTFYNYPAQGYDTSLDGVNGGAGSYYFYSMRTNGAGVYMRICSSDAGGNKVSLVPFGSTNCFYMFDDSDVDDVGSGYEDNAIFLKSNKSYSNYVGVYNQSIFSALDNWAGSLDCNVLWNNTTQNHTISVNNLNGFAGNYANSETSMKLGNETMSCNADVSSFWTEASAPKFAGTGYLSCGLIPSATLKGIKYSDRGLFNGTQQTINGCYGSTAGGRFRAFSNSTTRSSSKNPSGGQTWVYKFYWHKIYTSDVTNICNLGASSILNIPVRLYNGVPLTRVTNVGKISFSCTLNNTKGNDSYLTISDEPFDNANRYDSKTYTVGGKTYDHILYNKKISAGKSNDIEFDVEYIADESTPTVLYYRLSQETFNDNTVNMSITMDTGISMVVGGK